MVAARQQTNSMTVPEHPSQPRELWQLGLSPDGESSEQTAIIHGKPEDLGEQMAVDGASALPTPLQLAALTMRKGSRGSEKPPTDTSLASPGETACLEGQKAALAVDIWTPLMRPAQDGSSANCSSRQ